MSKLIATATALALLLCTLPAFIQNAYADDSDGNLTYRVDSGKAIVTGFAGPEDEDLVIPNKLGGYDITGIDDGAFRDCIGLISVTMPSTVNNIGSGAFSSCTNLITVNVPNTVTVIGANAFLACTNLQNITIPEGVNAIQERTFYACQKLTSLTIPQSVTSIKDHAFYACESLECIAIPSSVSSIGTSAFEYCYRLSDVYFGGNKSQWNDLIKQTSGCDALKNVNLHEGSSVIPPKQIPGWNASCTDAGSKSYYELNGKYYEDKACSNEISNIDSWKTIPAFGHSPFSTTTKATLSANGKTETKCSTCGAFIAADFISRPSSIELAKAALTYNGKSQSPGIVVKDANGNTIPSSCYTISVPAGCKNVGTYACTITFKGNYSGTKSLSFDINPKGTSISKLKALEKTINLKWKKQAAKMSKRISGYQIRYSTKSSMASAKTKDVKGFKKTSSDITNLKANKKYYIQIRTYSKVSGKTYYSDWSKKKSIVVK